MSTRRRERFAHWNERAQRWLERWSNRPPRWAEVQYLVVQAQVIIADTAKFDPLASPLEAEPELRALVHGMLQTQRQLCQIIKLELGRVGQQIGNLDHQLRSARKFCSPRGDLKGGFLSQSL